MFRLWKVAYFATGFAPLMDAPDAGGAGGDADPDGQGDGSQPPDDGADLGDGSQHASGDPAHAGDDDEDDDDEDEFADDEVPTPERWKKVTSKLRKQNRRVKKLQPVAQRHRELKEQGLTLDDLLVKARNYDSLDATIRGNKKLARAIYGGDAEDEPTTGRQSRNAPAVDEEFDESKLPFDPNANEANRYFANMAKQNFELQRELKKLAERQNQMDGRDTQRTVREEQGQWKTTIDATLKHIKDDGIRTVLSDALVAAFHARKSHGKTPQQVVDHYLKVLKVNPQEAAKAGAAAAAAAGNKPGATGRQATQQRIAEGNRTLPRTVAPTGTPAPARTGKERLSDVHKRLRSGFSAAR